MKLPDFPLPVFFQPVRNVQMLAGLGFNVMVGPCVENDKALPPADLLKGQLAWIDAVEKSGMGAMVKEPWRYPISPGIVGVTYTVDEPNGKGKTPEMLKPEYAMLRQTTTLPILLTLAGDKITSANFDKPAELQLYADYLALCDIVAIDMYSMNRNASRYKTSWTADGVAKLRKHFPSKPVWFWYEMNDQRLPPPTAPDVNRGPTPDEIEETIRKAIAAGATGAGAFATCDSGKYGWPDSFWPLVDRSGKSIQANFDRIKAVNASLSKPVTPPVPDYMDWFDEMDRKLDAITAQLNAITAQLDAITAQLDAVLAQQKKGLLPAP